MHIAVGLEVDKTAALELPAFLPEEKSFWLNNAIRKFTKTRYSGSNVKGKSFEENQKRIDDLRSIVVESQFVCEELDDTIISGDTTLDNSWSLNTALNEWPTDYWLTISEACLIYPTNGGETHRVGVVESTADELAFRLSDPLSEHILHYNTAKPLRLYTQNSVELITDGNYNVVMYYLTYLKKPQTIDVANVASGSIVAGVTYGIYNTDSSYVTYDSENYYTGDTFIGVSGTTTYTPSGTSTVNTACNLPEHTHDEIVKLAASMMLENIEQPRYSTHMNEVGTME